MAKNDLKYFLSMQNVVVTKSLYLSFAREIEIFMAESRQIVLEGKRTSRLRVNKQDEWWIEIMNITASYEW